MKTLDVDTIKLNKRALKRELQKDRRYKKDYQDNTEFQPQVLPKLTLQCRLCRKNTAEVTKDITYHKFTTFRILCEDCWDKLEIHNCKCFILEKSAT